MYNLRRPYSNELYHHGIKGQKWGVRRFQNVDGTLTAAGKERYNSGVIRKNSNVPSKNKGSADIVLATAVLFAPEIIYTTTALVNSAKRSSEVRKSKNLQAQCSKERAEAKTDSASGLKIQKTPKSLEENVKRVNPQYGEGKWSKNPDLASSVTNNCVDCSITLEMRRRGYEVQALYNNRGKEGLKDGQKCFKKAKPVYVIKAPDPPKNSQERDAYLNFYINAENERMAGNRNFIKKATEAMSKEPVGSRGMLCVDWDKYSGHAMGYEIMPGGKLRIIDGQVGKIYDGKSVNKILKYALSFEYERLDNLEVNYKNIKESVK